MSDMLVFIVVIAGYLSVLTVLNFLRARKVKTQDDMMVAGRTLSLWVIVFTLICTWIGSGTFIAGAEYAYYAGWSSLWMPAGAWIGILVIYFLAARIRTFGQYTVGDILEVRYGRFARLFGAVAIVIAFTTIVAYQFRAGGYILNVLTDGAVSVDKGQMLAAAFVILFTALGGMVAVAYTDLPNGIVIVLACVIAVPFVVASAGGWDHAAAVLPASRFDVFSADFGRFPAAKAIAYAFSTMLLLMGIQSMYQKFYAARSAAEAKAAVGVWILGTIVVETVVVVIAIYASSFDAEFSRGWDARAMVLQAAKSMVPLPVGVLLLGAACAVVISTGMNYLLSPSTNVMRDVYQKFFRPDADPKRMAALQKLVVVGIGLLAFLMIWVPTVMGSNISVLQYSYFAYTIYGVAITPALLAALTWKRATRLGGVLSIVLGTVSTLFLEVVVPWAWPSVMQGAASATGADVFGRDPWGVPSIYPSFAISVLGLVIGSYLSKPPAAGELEPVFGERTV
jgi:SSS family solute:Na+ symporter/sodium/proline symporter